MKKLFRYLKTRPLAFAGIVILAFLYLIMIFAEFIAPYPANLTFENNTFHPANVKITREGIVAKEAATISTINWKYAYVAGARHKVRFFVKGAPYSDLFRASGICSGRFRKTERAAKSKKKPETPILPIFSVRTIWGAMFSAEWSTEAAFRLQLDLWRARFRYCSRLFSAASPAFTAATRIGR